MTMTTGKEWMAEALAVEQMHGDRAFAFIAERVVELRNAGDAAGVRRWLAIGVCLQQLGDRPEKPN